ncbi:LCP family protein [Catenulispora yoronensis]|uniref:LCP family protein n=1 Tax=Catenulispora yoronensis TaxID=450799 RepID=A0ABP5F958_9ACTN
MLIGGPVLGVALGTALGGYHGPLFAVLTVASAALATASARPNGRWWVMLSAPPVAWLVAAAAELLLHDPPYRDTKAKAVGLVHATSHAFPVILVAAVAMGVVWTAAVVAAKPSRNRARSRPRTRPRRPAPGLVAGRALASFLGLAVVATTGFVWFENKQLTDGVHTTGSIKEVKQGDDGYVPPHLGNDVNLLLIGLDSRKDMDGNDLPTQFVEDALHAGSSGIGGYNTNVLILLHIPANGGRVTAYSIPRDDYVERPGGTADVPGLGSIKVPDLGVGKIKEAYGNARAYAESKIVASGLKDKAKIEAESREVGREATLRAVQKLTGVHVDHLAEVNLLGFYDVVKAIGTIQVCLKAPADDPIENGAGTGLKLPAGVSTIDAATALQFVRQRYHLLNGDLDRTHRQQAFLSSVTHTLRQKGVLGDLGAMQSLFDVVKKDIVIDDGWSVLDFAQQASNLTGGNATFYTLPIKSTAEVPDAPGSKTTTSVNLVDPALIKKTVTEAFGNDAAVAPPVTPSTTASGATPPPPNPSTSPAAPAAPKGTITVNNGTRTTGLASKVSGALFAEGIAVAKTGNGGNNVARTTVRYGAASADLAKKLQTLLGTKTAPVADKSLAADAVVVTIGYDYKLPPDKPVSTPSGSVSSGSTSTGATGATGSSGSSAPAESSGLSSGGALDMSSQDGIPCVY